MIDQDPVVFETDKFQENGQGLVNLNIIEGEKGQEQHGPKYHRPVCSFESAKDHEQGSGVRKRQIWRVRSRLQLEDAKVEEVRVEAENVARMEPTSSMDQNVEDTRTTTSTNSKGDPGAEANEAQTQSPTSSTSTEFIQTEERCSPRTNHPVWHSSRTWMEHRADERYPVRSALGYQDHDVRNGSNEWSWSCNCLHSKHPVPVHTKGRQTRRSKSHSYCEAPDRNSPWRRWRRCHHGPRKKGRRKNIKDFPSGRPYGSDHKVPVRVLKLPGDPLKGSPTGRPPGKGYLSDDSVKGPPTERPPGTVGVLKVPGDPLKGSPTGRPPGKGYLFDDSVKRLPTGRPPGTYCIYWREDVRVLNDRLPFEFILASRICLDSVFAAKTILHYFTYGVIKLGGKSYEFLSTFLLHIVVDYAYCC